MTARIVSLAAERRARGLPPAAPVLAPAAWAWLVWLWPFAYQLGYREGYGAGYTDRLWAEDRRRRQRR